MFTRILPHQFRAKATSEGPCLNPWRYHDDRRKTGSRPGPYRLPYRNEAPPHTQIWPSSFDPENEEAADDLAAPMILKPLSSWMGGVGEKDAGGWEGSGASVIARPRRIAASGFW